MPRNGDGRCLWRFDASGKPGRWIYARFVRSSHAHCEEVTPASPQPNMISPRPSPVFDKLGCRPASFIASTGLSRNATNIHPSPHIIRICKYQKKRARSHAKDKTSVLDSTAGSVCIQLPDYSGGLGNIKTLNQQCKVIENSATRAVTIEPSTIVGQPPSLAVTTVTSAGEWSCDE